MVKRWCTRVLVLVHRGGSGADVEERWCRNGGAEMLVHMQV